MVRRSGLWNATMLAPFPTALENTATSAALLDPRKHARSLVNLLPNGKKAGSGTPRFGMAPSGPPFASDHLDGWEFTRQDGSSFVVTAHADGSLQAFDGASYTTIKTGLSSSGLLYAVQFNHKLVFCNGIDPNFAYDGNAVTDLGEYVTDYSGTGLANGRAFGKANDPEWVSTNSFSLTPGPTRNDYLAGRPIRVTFATTGLVDAVVQSTNLVGGMLTITVDGTPFPASDEAITRVEYFDKPPPFSFLHTKHNILWALRGGETRARVNRPGDGMTVYYQPASNNENAWFSQGEDVSTQDVTYLSLRNQTPFFDELVGISDLDENMVFHGRKSMHLYGGYDPNTVGGFVFAKSIPVGTVHGKLIQKIPSDVAFVSPSGIVSLRRVFTTEAPEVLSDIGSAVDPTIDDKLLTLNSEDVTFRNARSFYSQRAGLLGFKLDDMNMMVYCLSERSKGWTEFSGYFTNARSFITLSDGRLLVGRGGQLYAYANGTDPLAGISYTDNGEPLSIEWWLPWQSLRGRGWSNRGYEVLLEKTSTVALSIDRMIDYNESNAVTTLVGMDSTGAMWDEAQWDQARWDSTSYNPYVSDKFYCENAYSLRVRGQISEDFSLLGIKPIGK